jgi:2-polyprenyl-6-hydroxyphenyl methylase/3-demethylubiquinone-9 3-methyltransferase
MATIDAKHQSEVDRGERFEFGRNWARFLANITPERIEIAENSLKTFLQADRLDHKSFLDIGSGSGLFSLAARRLGARVHSFDYDTQSVACTRELRRRYCPDDPNWVVEQGSVLDTGYLHALGTFDIVYSWGVLHHTGAMWQALENVKPLVPVGGQLFIAIYNDQGALTDRWASIKQTYNSLPRPLAFLFALGIIAQNEARELASHYRHGSVRDWLRNWSEYQKVSTRGMSRWYDWIDWIGGYPYERASVEQIVDVFAKDGFRLTKLQDRSGGYGCNEFVFRRDGPAGTVIDVPIPGSQSLARAFGRRVSGPFELTERGWTGVAQNPPSFSAGSALYLIRDEALVGAVSLDADRRVVVAPAQEGRPAVESAILHVVAGEAREIMPPFAHARGRMWAKTIADLAPIADRVGADRQSPVFLFEAGRQLPRPHAIHDDIDKHGGGRFSHWENSIFFSTVDGTDPNTNGRSYLLFIPAAGANPDGHR